VFKVAFVSTFITKIVDTQVDVCVISTFTVELFTERNIIFIKWHMATACNITNCTVKLELCHQPSVFVSLSVDISMVPMHMC
jgi:hypothetical protein